MLEMASCPACGARWEAEESSSVHPCPACCKSLKEKLLLARPGDGERRALGEIEGVDSGDNAEDTEQSDLTDLSTRGAAVGGPPADAAPTGSTPLPAPAEAQDVAGGDRESAGDETVGLPGAERPGRGAGPLPRLGSPPPGGAPVPLSRTSSSRDEGGDPPRGEDDTVGVVPTRVDDPAIPLDHPGQWKEGAVLADRFHLVKFVGQGGMGKVFLAQDLTLGRPMALKCIPQEIIFDGDARDDLRQEANRLLDLAHENIVRVHTYYDGPTWPFLAMEYLQGPTLKKLLRQRRQAGRAFSPEEILRIARQVVRGLEHAHAMGIIHRDLKPSNLMLATPPVEDQVLTTDRVKITDFGVSRVVADSTLRQTGKRSGTLPYMSPEQFRGETCTVQSDIYSLACTLYELLSGKPPFHTGDIGYQIVQKAPPALPPAVPRAMGNAIFKGLSKAPEDRFASSTAFLEALEGRTLVFPRRMVLRRLRQAAMAASAIVVLAFVGLGLRSFLSSETEKLPRTIEPAKPPSVSAIQASANQAKRLELVANLRLELERQIPLIVSWESPLLGAASGDGTVSLRFSFPEPTESNYVRTLLENLRLQYYSTDPEAGTHLVGSVLVEGSRVFVLDGLREGAYTLRAFLESRGEGEAQFEPLLNDALHKFRIDLTAPSFNIVPVRPEAFVTAAPPNWSTFDESVEMEIRSPAGPEEIANAYAQLVYGQQTTVAERIPDPTRWRVLLPPGVTSTFGVYAVDAAGNRSAAFQVNLRRLRLDVENFGIDTKDGVRGNIVTVRGYLLVEGQESPSLVYFVQGRRVEPLPASPPDAAESAALSQRIPFAASLRLPELQSDIEVRYSWKGEEPRRFAVPVVLKSVRVRPPEITWSREAPAFTNQTSLRLEGKVEPSFEGLEMSVESVGREVWKVPLVAANTGAVPAANFVLEVPLAERTENLLRIHWFYGNTELTPSPPTIKVSSDTLPPTLRCVFSIDPDGSALRATIRPSEPLQLLRVQEFSGGEGIRRWMEVTGDPATELEYVHVMPVPSEPFTLRIEMTDLAGNVVEQEQFCPLSKASVASAALPAGSGPAEAGAPVAGVTVIRSPFLRDAGIEFVPIGPDRLEIARTEVSERIWSQFLRESKGRSDVAQGRAEYAMTLEESPPGLLREFATWFERMARDGYTYRLPTTDEWLAAFAGQKDPARARPAIREWFGSIGGAGFKPAPEVRYGINKATPMGCRTENQTPTGLLDMEAGVQEMVLDGELYKVLGGSNRDLEKDFLQQCLEARPYETLYHGRVTGFRLVRKPILSN